MMLPLSESARVTRAYNQSLGLRLAESPPQRMPRCHYCPDRPGATDDHIVPKALGGSNRRLNIVPACQRCNGTKGDRWPTCQCERCTTARRVFLAQRIEASTATLRERFPAELDPPTSTTRRKRRRSR